MQRRSSGSFLSVWIFSVLGASTGLAQTNVVVDTTQKFQVIDNFGASDAWTIQPIVSKWMRTGDEKAIDQLADLLFSTETGIGLTAWRFNVGAGSAEQGVASRIPDPLRRVELMITSPNAEVDASKQAGQVRMLKEAHERGVEDLIVFANSPPVWATKNGLAHPADSAGRESTNLDPRRVQDFAEFLVKVVVYLRSEPNAIPIKYISPINEPTWEWEGQTQEGTPYNVREIKHVYRALHNALNRRGLADRVHVDGPEAVEYTAALSDADKIAFDGKPYDGGMNKRGLGLYRNYIDEFLGDPEMQKILDNKISLHGYFSDAWEDRLGDLRDFTLKNVRRVSPSARIWMSEFCILGDAGNVRNFSGGGFDPDDMEFALHLGKVVHRDMTRLNASAWQWWLAVTPYDYKDGLLKIEPSLEPATLKTSKAFWVLGHFSRFVRPGFQRVAVSNPDALDGLMVSAFESPNGGENVVIFVNAGEAQKIMLRDSNGVSYLNSTASQVYVTDATRDLRKVESGGDLVLPKQSVVTIVYNAVSN